jgi:hypothetical protein
MKHNSNDFGLPHIPSIKEQGLDHGVLMAMYLMGSTSLRDFLQPLGATGYKAGLSARRYMDQKILDIRLRGYGSVVAPLHDRDNAISIHPLPKEWFLSRLPDPADDADAMELLKQLPEGSYNEGVVLFRLPPGLSIAKVEKSFQALLEPRNLNTFLGSDDGKSRLKAFDLPEDTRLFTDYFDMGRTRRSLACEIFLVRPQRELAVLLRALILAIQLETHAS